MTTDKRARNGVWVIILLSSLLFLVWTLLVLTLSRGSTLEESLALARSPLVTDNLDEVTHGFLTMAMLKPLWEEVWVGVMGIYCALGIRQQKRHAWTLGLFWGIMLMTNGANQGGYELLVLKWPYACMQTYMFLLLGAITVLSLSVTRKRALGYRLGGAQ